MNFLKNIGKKAKPIAKSLLCKKVLMLAIVAACAISPALAADGIAGKLTEIGANFKGYVEPVRNIVYALAAICVMLTVGGCAGLVALATALPAMFD